jgi:triacylglycerol lipase
VAFVANSRGSTIVRNFLKNGGGDLVTSHAVLGGGVNHGAYDVWFLFPTSEFNGSSPFLQQLNEGPTETVPGVDFLTLRSDFFDKYAQPDSRFLLPPSFPVIPTGVGFNAPALKGARNVVLPGVDHREASTSLRAFQEAFTFITGAAPQRASIVEEDRPVLAGTITGITADVYNNKPVADARLQIFAVDRTTGERQGDALYQTQTGKDGAWGPFTADSDASYEFVLQIDGLPVTHIYRSPFLRSSEIVHLRPAFPVGSEEGGSVIILNRLSGYFGVEDTVLLDSVRPPLSTDKVPNEVETTVRVPLPQATHLARFNREQIALQNWPKGHVSIVQFTD